ncbi:AraC family transcriptional regulator [Pelagibacterium lentulum]|uniref:AraC family transcriptional regulator n=1 Tax=Pelagibacterium lentulum TaxID=2029865 RepID=A0A916R7U7_9HYPH|nr:AraC family transcriptional regulator [Pelagibacterium lentulum]GGA39317.1 AraC family transcriptional regulator [Pelagibacterium lentulum]
MDLLSSILRDLRLESVLMSVGEFGAPWGIEKARVEGFAPFHIVLEGNCLFRHENGEAVELVPGDLVLLAHGDPHWLQSDAAAPTVPFSEVLAANGGDASPTARQRLEGLPRLRFGGTGASTRMLNGVFTFGEGRRNPLTTALPSVMHVSLSRGRNVDDWVSRSLQFLIDETETGNPGFQTIAERTADIIFVQAVRDYLTGIPADAAGWLRALGDPPLARALALVHERPDHPWTIATLARKVGLSRTVFASRFRHCVGEGVMAYVTARRMHVASQLLLNTQRSMAEIAVSVGYESEISFSRAFRRWCGEPPGRYRRNEQGRAANPTAAVLRALAASNS